jgi:hypothetical protein
MGLKTHERKEHTSMEKLSETRMLPLKVKTAIGIASVSEVEEEGLFFFVEQKHCRFYNLPGRNFFQADVFVLTPQIRITGETVKVTVNNKVFCAQGAVPV